MGISGTVRGCSWSIVPFLCKKTCLLGCMWNAGLLQDILFFSVCTEYIFRFPDNQSAPIHLANSAPFGSFRCSLGEVRTHAILLRFVVVIDCHFYVSAQLAGSFNIFRATSCISRRRGCSPFSPPPPGTHLDNYIARGSVQHSHWLSILSELFGNANSRSRASIDATEGLTPLELQSRFGGNPLKFQVNCLQLSPKRNCSPKRLKSLTAVLSRGIRS